MRVRVRISKDEYYLDIAEAVSRRSTCLRRQYGVVITKDDRIIATGYNGSARGEENCCDVGSCWREAHGVPHGEQYEKCVGIHAEDNAITAAGREAIGATLYLVGIENGEQIRARPCVMCRRKIINSGVSRVVMANEYGGFSAQRMDAKLGADLPTLLSDLRADPDD